MRIHHRFTVALAAALVAGCATHTTKSTAITPITVPKVAHPQGETPQWWYYNGAARAANNGAMAGKARNVILFLGDGMSIPTVAAARILEGQRKGGSGEENALSWENFPATALSKTYNINAQTPDSAGTMSAIMTGVKTFEGAISVSAGRRADCADTLNKGLLTWLQLADSAGLATGVVSTARITHATPAATYAHSPERNWESDADVPENAKAVGCTDIAQQLLTASRFGRGPQVVLGGGRREFQSTVQHDPEYPGKTGHRLDGRNLVAEWQQMHPDGVYVWNSRDLKAAKDAPSLLGLFEPSHMQFEHERNRTPNGEPSLAELTTVAIQNLARSPEGFALMVEGGRIDHAHHAGNAFHALDETISLSDAVRAAVQTAPPDTLIIVTADHSHAFNFGGYSTRGNPILNKAAKISPNGDVTYVRDMNGQPYTTLNYVNGPGYPGKSNLQPAGPKHFPHEPSSVEYTKARPNLEQVNTQDPNYMQESMIPLQSETHGGDDVGIWATGPGSEAIRGTVEQNTLYHFIVQSMPKLRSRLCELNTCNSQGVPVNLPNPTAFEK